MYDKLNISSDNNIQLLDYNLAQIANQTGKMKKRKLFDFFNT